MIPPEQQERAGSYARQSRASTKSIQDQATENRAAADRRGWRLDAEYEDGASASRFARKARDDWAQVLADVTAAKLDVLILWEPSRGDRDPATWLAFLATCRERRVRIHVTSHDTTYDLTNARHWRTLAEDGIDAGYESEKISIRVRRGQASAAAAGSPAHGRVPFGYRRTYDQRSGALLGQEPDPATAPVVVEIITRASKGEAISTITDDLNARAVPTLTARNWYRARVRDLATNVAYVGIRRHNGETHPGAWPALVDPAVFYAAQRTLTDPRRVTTRPGRQVHLLSYLGKAAPCGGDLCAARGRYRCIEDGCITVLQAPVDHMVTEMILARIERPDAYSALRAARAASDQEVIEAQAEIEQLKSELDKWRLSAARRKTSPESLAVIEADLTQQMREAEQREKQAGMSPALRQMLEPGVDVRQRWRDAPLPAQRDVIRTLTEIAIAPASVTGRHAFEPLRLAPSRWVGDERTWGDIWASSPS